MPRKRIPAPPDELLTSVEALARDADPDNVELPNQYRRLFIGGWTTAHRTPKLAVDRLDDELGDGGQHEPGTVGAATCRVRALGYAHGLRAAAKCQACGRPLTNRTSVARLIGPECWRKGLRARVIDYLDPEEEPRPPAPRATPVASWHELTIDEVLAEVRRGTEGLAGSFMLSRDDWARHTAHRLADGFAEAHHLTEHRVDSYDLVDGLLTVVVVGRRKGIPGVLSGTVTTIPDVDPEPDDDRPVELVTVEGDLL